MNKYWVRAPSWAPYLEIKCDACKEDFLNKSFEPMAISITPFILHICYLCMPTLRQVQTENLNSFNTREKLTVGQKCLKFLCFCLAICPLIFFYIMIRTMQGRVKNEAARGWYLYWMTSAGLLVGLPLMVFLMILLYRKCG
jgi:cytochrome bd-type quinol oxidase subunit 2